MELSEFHKLLRDFKKPVSLCMYRGPAGEACTNKPISSHSVQKSVALKGLAEGGHVLCFESKFSGTGRELSFAKIGYSKASVFPGYCKKHDREQFAGIETDFVTLGPKEICLLSLRAISREVFAKKAEKRLYRQTLEKLPGGDARREEIEYMIANAKLAEGELEEIKILFEKALQDEDYSSIVSRSWSFDVDLPFAFTGSFPPEHTLLGENIRQPPTGKWGAIVAFCGRIGSADVMTLSYIEGTVDEHILPFFTSIDATEPNPREFAFNLGVEFIENIFFRPSWIESLDPKVKFQIIEKGKRGLPGIHPHVPNFWSELTLFPD